MVELSVKLIEFIAPGLETDELYQLWNYFLDWILLQPQNIPFESIFNLYFNLKEWDPLNQLVFSIAKYVPIEFNVQFKSYKKLFGFLIK